MAIRLLDPRAVKPRLTADREIAFIDVREHGQYGDGHPFFSVNMPYSRLELLAETLLPRKDVPVILFDGDDGIASKAAKRLTDLGYTDLAFMAGGAPAWAKAGFELFKGVHVPSKAFGEAVEHVCDTPRITADDLKARLDNNDNFVLLDGRTPSEFRRMNIPGGHACPNGELAYRISDMVPADTTPIVINCAGRTRSIIGAQTLINFGVSNPVVALENGTQGWQLAGYDLQRGAVPGRLPEPSSQRIEDIRAAAESIRKTFNIAAIDLDTLRTWQTDATRSLYLLDVRTAEEYAAGHMSGARHAPGGQLVQATDQWVAVRGARIVLVDDSGIRATSAAMWL
ncbi:MAG: rhodanese-like domain-containing protein, partial [Methyloligellaceae bacterium]